MPTLRLPQPWIPHRPTTKQAAFLMFDGLEAFFGGAAGGGKTDALLMAALQYVDQPKYNAVLFRRSYTDLALPGALMDRAHEWLRGSQARWDRERHSYTFPSGATLSFGYIQTAGDKWRYQSAEYQFIGWDEITEFPDDDAYRFLFSRLRRLEGADIPLRVRCASNPSGVGTYWVKERFIDDPEDRAFFFSKFTDNPYLDQESYLLSLQQLHPALQKRLIEGSWDAVEDTAFPEFNEEIHAIPSYRPPQNWRRWEAMDFGVTNPTAWHAAATDGEFVVIHGEYYQAGLISDHASRVLTLRENRWGQPTITLCDPSIRARTGFGESGRGETVHSEFSKHGLFLVPANNDRIEGRVRISEMLRPDMERVFPQWHPKAGEVGAPRLFITQECPNLLKQIKFAPLDAVTQEVVDPYWETRHGHAVASARYLVAARVLSKTTQVEQAVGGRTMREWNPWKEWTQVG
jgi:hypothetical protein